MKKIKTILMIFSLIVMYQFGNAQNCQGNKVKVSKGFKGGCGCTCQSKCVLQSEVQTYIDNGWYIGDCIVAKKFCCGGWFRNSNAVDNTETMLTDIHPDPFSKAFTISFNLSKQSKVSLQVFDMTGRYIATVANKTFEKNSNEITWNAGKINTGIYFLKMTAGEFNETRKISVIN